MRFLEIRFVGKDKRYVANPVSTMLLIPMISAPQFLGVLFWDNFLATVWSALLRLLWQLVFGINFAKRPRGSNV